MIAVVASILVLQKAMLLHAGTTFQIRLDPNARHPLQVWLKSTKVCDGLIPDHHPWALEIADVDGDGDDDIVVGINETTRYLKFPHKTLFVMHFDGKQLSRKWAGSTLGRPFTEFCFGPKVAGQGQLLVTLDRCLDGQLALTAHRWSGFGFQKVGNEKFFTDASGLHVEQSNLVLTSNHRLVSIPIQGLL